MSLLKSVVLLCLVAFVAGTVYKPKPFKRYQPGVVPAISSKALCGDQYITATGGNILSPNYPNDYDASNSCGWFLTAQNGGRIAVAIVDLKTESPYDAVIIRDGVSGTSPVLLEIAGEASNLAVLSTVSSIFVGFFPDSSVQDRGFNITWRETDLTDFNQVFHFNN